MGTVLHVLRHLDPLLDDPLLRQQRVFLRAAVFCKIISALIHQILAQDIGHFRIKSIADGNAHSRSLHPDQILG